MDKWQTNNIINPKISNRSINWYDWWDLIIILNNYTTKCQKKAWLICKYNDKLVIISPKKQSGKIIIIISDKQSLQTTNKGQLHSYEESKSWSSIEETIKQP
jgi:hypothetical protein